MVQSSGAPRVRTAGGRAAAVAEVLLVYLAVFALIWAIALLPIGQVERWFLSYVVMMAFPLLILILARRNLAEYGLSIHRLQDQVQIALAAFLPVAVASAIYGWLLPLWIPRAIVRWEGALILVVVEVAILFWVARALREKPTLAPALPALLALVPLAAGPAIPQRLLSFLFYLLFLGPGEEFLFRGYIQSRLNTAFGRPYCSWGISWGWGLIIASLIFGLMHVLNPFNPFLGKLDLYPWWGLWTIVGGLTLGYVREKAGSVLPPALLHGVPQAIASLFWGFFAIR